MLSLVMHIYPWISLDILGYPWPMMLRQDYCLILPPYPFSLEDPSDMSLEGMWHARPQLSLKCLLRPRNGRPPKNATWTCGPDDMEASLVFFSTFEELKLPSTGPMDRATTKLCKLPPTQILYVAPCENMLGRVPLFPCFLQGNATPTIPHKLRPQGQRVSVWDSQRSRCGRT